MIDGVKYRFKNELAERLFKFSVDVINFLRQIPDTAETKIIKNQLIKAATSGGANYEESQAGISKREFAMKVGISLKEIREANYWLRLMMETKLANSRKLEELMRESDELRLILGTIVTKLHRAVVKEE